MSSLQHFQNVSEYLRTQIIGQPALVEQMLVALLADGHMLVEGAPGLAKTRAIKALSNCISGSFQRIQFTPDLLPADITGSDIFRPETQSFDFQPGPIFHSLILADEINRAPAKVQSALLEAMAERQVTVGNKTYPLPGVFLVMATQNPIEQEGTYPLPEAQLDRFLLHVVVDYPDVASEQQILRLTRDEARRQLDTAPAGARVLQPEPSQPEASDSAKGEVQLTHEDIFTARLAVLDVFMNENVEHYIVRIIQATRDPGLYDQTIAGWLDYGASPRATIAIDRCARAAAWLAGNDYVSPDDVRKVAHDVLRHRIIPSFRAEAEGMSRDAILARLLDVVPVP
ncbi:AAA family ATPase [Allohahella sp. A8]|uniref:AAA family ATPase n=1 Tax=Allohahella sp. A8 TaxID=3141461 RepID=UPI000C0A6C19|nr:AAA family ATPase [Hahellaceae bacterium]|tara:strand:+ start:51380 stop:52405 length:1026 start_codon:yes stop_codon:yes gene_type:complete